MQLSHVETQRQNIFFIAPGGSAVLLADELPLGVFYRKFLPLLNIATDFTCQVYR